MAKADTNIAKIAKITCNNKNSNNYGEPFKLNSLTFVHPHGSNSAKKNPLTKITFTILSIQKLKVLY